MLRKKIVILATLAAALLLPSCSNSPWASQLERSLAADPSLENGSLFGSSPPASSQPTPGDSADQAQLLSNFPAEIPRYPNARLLTTTFPDQATSDLPIGQPEVTQTQWITPDSAAQVQQFYQEQFQTANWQLISQAPINQAPINQAPTVQAPASPTSASPTTAAEDSIVAERDGLRVTVTIPTTTPTTATTPTGFSIDYQFANAGTTSPTSSPDNASAQASAIPQPGDPDFIGPVPPANWGTASTTNSPSTSSAVTSSAATSQIYADLNQAPAELQPYIVDLAKLGALPLQATAETTKASSNTTAELKPNQAITRREYARWLVTANNLIYANQPARKIRLAVASDQPSFSDVPASDPDFGAIQGLANAGLIPSSLSGDATAVTFRPDAPLTREALALWKVPIDLQQSLPNATIEAVQQAWGFQDAARIDPVALKAVLADHQNGDLSNIRRAFGYTTLFQPKKAVTRAEAAAALWFFGLQADGLSAKDALQANQPQTNQLQTNQSPNQPQVNQPQ